MSRADREKSLYIIRLNQIREELRIAFPQEFDQIQSQKNNDEALAQREVKSPIRCTVRLRLTKSAREKKNEEKNRTLNVTELAFLT